MDKPNDKPGKPMTLGDITKNIRRRETPVEIEVTPVQPTAAVTTVYRTSPPWQLLQALHMGNEKGAERIIENSKLNESEKLLLHAIRASWYKPTNNSEMGLKRLVKQLEGTDRTWANLMLAIMYLDTANSDEAGHYISVARRYEGKLDEQLLPLFVDLIDARCDIERGSPTRAQRLLTGILKDCDDHWIKGHAHYLLGCLGQFEKAENQQDSINHLHEAVSIFEEKVPDRYLAALSRLEITKLIAGVEPATAAKLAENMALEFNSLGREREASTAAGFAAQIGIMASVQATKPAEGFKVVGKCHFISDKMVALYINLVTVAQDKYPALILGERGTGKEEIARAIHQLSERRDGPFIAINCSILGGESQMVDDELFGHEKGAFTGATGTKQGKFELANKGTIFLDEVGELPLTTQAKLLRVVQQGTFYRVGGSVEIKHNARILAATNRDLDEMSHGGEYRLDLLDRLSSTWKLNIPPLRERREEILPLAEMFIEREAEGKIFQLDRDARELLMSYDYPGNVRDLEGMIRRGISNARAEKKEFIAANMIFRNDVGAGKVKVKVKDENEKGDSSIPVWEIDEIPNFYEAVAQQTRRILEGAINACGGNFKLAATKLGLSVSTFYRRCNETGIIVNRQR
jgi:transcriptional regulator with GAF, ATPase, and Fis domain